MNRMKRRRKELGVSLHELGAVLGQGFSPARLSIAERGLIELSEVEHQIVSEAVERLGSLRSRVRRVVETAQEIDLVGYCANIRQRAASLHAAG